MTLGRAAFLRERFGVRAGSLVVLEGGWDSDVLEVDGTWIFRFPRRREVEAGIRVEIALLPELAAALPVAIPCFEFISETPLCVGYRKLAGRPVDGAVTEAATELGRFLAALHAFPVARARELGVPAPDWRRALEKRFDEFRLRAFPLLDAGERPRAEAIFARLLDLAGGRFTPSLLHADLGPAHVLHDDGRVTGVVDWTDTRIGDPALDLAWPLNGTSEAFAAALIAGYGEVDDGLRERALLYHRRGPWYEVTYGLDVGDDTLVASGLAGVRARLP